MNEPKWVCTGDEIVLRKPHPCGANHWLVLRDGADIRLQCAGCGHRLILPRRQVEQRIVRFLARGPRAQRATPPPDQPE